MRRKTTIGAAKPQLRKEVKVVRMRVAKMMKTHLTARKKMRKKMKLKQTKVQAKMQREKLKKVKIKKKMVKEKMKETVKTRATAMRKTTLKPKIDF